MEVRRWKSGLVIGELPSGLVLTEIAKVPYLTEVPVKMERVCNISVIIVRLR